MATITFDDLNNSLTCLNATEILDILNKYVAGLPSGYYATLTEQTYDQLYDEFLPHGNASNMWLIEFDIEDEGRLRFNYDTFYLVPRYEILVSFLENTTDTEPNFIDFTNNSNVRSNLCDNEIIQMKFLIKKEEFQMENRYAAREPLLMLINGSIVNYRDFNNEDLKQINNDKNVSKKRRVLENPWFHREVLELLEDTTNVVPEYLLNR